MTAVEQAICSLISHSIFGSPLDLPADFDWDDVLKEAEQQTIVGIVAYALPEGVKPQWKYEYYQNAMHHVQILHAQSQLIAMINEAGIPLAILKGAAAAIYYPEPSLRSMGDIDFLVPQDRFHETYELMVNNGYVVTCKEDGENARHIGLSKNGIAFELHHHFSYFDFDLEEYLTDGIQHTEIASIGQFSFPMLPPLENGMVLLAHMRTHLKSGLGLRQVVDWMVYVDKVLDDEFWMLEFKEVVEKAGLKTFAITTTRMCQMYLGLSEKITWCREADEELATRLLDNLFLSGNFGRKQGTGGHVEKVGTEIKRLGFFRYLQIAGEKNWKAYKKHRWLKPLCWLYQIGRYIKQAIKSRRGKEVIHDLKRSDDRHELLKDLGI